MHVQMNASEWDQVAAAVETIAENPTQSRVDFKFGVVTVLVYRAGTVIRVDIKETG